MRLEEEFLAAIRYEIGARKHLIGSEQINSIYFGGGTPTMLIPDKLEALIDLIFENYQIAENVEITIEANPDNLSESYLSELVKTPVNRLSIGIQSFETDDLKYLKRIHTAEEADTALSMAKAIGFDNISADLIFGIPGLTDEKLHCNIDKLLSYAIQHVSAYALTVEPETPLESLIKKGKRLDVSDEDQAHQFTLIGKRLKKAGFDHYEISNYALPGQRSRHNSSYWQKTAYLGFGPSAHSYLGGTRSWNVANLKHYIEACQSGELAFETEELSRNDRFNELIMCSVRTIEGLDLKSLSEQFGSALATQTIKSVETELDPGWYRIEENRLQLTEKGKLYADQIASRLFLVD